MRPCFLAIISLPRLMESGGCDWFGFRLLYVVAGAQLLRHHFDHID